LREDTDFNVKGREENPSYEVSWHASLNETEL